MAKDSIKKAVVRFFEIQRQDIAKAKKQEKIQVNINPDCYVGKEIAYQTALLKQIQEEVQYINFELENIQIKIEKQQKELLQILKDQSSSSSGIG